MKMPGIYYMSYVFFSVPNEKHSEMYGRKLIKPFVNRAFVNGLRNNTWSRLPNCLSA